MIKLLNNVAALLYENMQWLFSGLGVSVLSLLISSFLKKKKTQGNAVTVNGNNNQVATIIINFSPDFIFITLFSIILGLIIFVVVWAHSDFFLHPTTSFMVIGISLGVTFCSWYMIFLLYRKNCTRKLEVEGIYLSSINNTNSNISLNRWIKFEEIIHTYSIKKTDLFAENKCKGKVSSKRFDNSVAFSVFGESPNVDSVQGHGFDLLADPDEKHKITPLSVKCKNISTILKVPLSTRAEIGSEVRCKFVTPIFGCMKYGKDYVSAYAASSTKSPIKFTVNLRFYDDFPTSVRTYHIDYSDFLPKIKFDRVLYCKEKSNQIQVYTDETIIKSRHYQKIYIFERKAESNVNRDGNLEST